MDKLVLIDGNSIAFRAFYALPLLSNSSGLHTNAAYGFTTMLLKLIEDEKPTHFLVAFDAGKVTFRHKEYGEYKGGRAKTPPELSEQFPLIKQLLESFNIAQMELEGYEADDIIGTYTRLADELKRKVVVVTGDKDMLQLASEYVTIYLTRKGISEVDEYNPGAIQEKYGLTPKQIIDLKGLMGDASDNIPGIPGVGEKTALKLLHEYGTVEQVLAHSDQIKGKMREKIEQHADDARMSKELATIYREVPLAHDFDKLVFGEYDVQAVGSMLRKLEFKSLLDRLDISGSTADEAEQQSIEVRVLGAGQGTALVTVLSSVSAIHVEAVGGNPHQSDVIGLAFFTEQACYYLPFALLASEEYEPVREWLGDASVKKTMYDVHKAQIALFWRGIALEGVEFDVMLAAYLLDPTETNLSFYGLTQKFRLSLVPEDEVIYGKGAKFKLPEEAQIADFVSRKAAAVHGLAPVLKIALEDRDMHALYYDLELPLASVLSGMEQKGIRVDAEGLRALGAEFVEQLDKLEKRIHELAGTEFNIGSPKQLGDILFDKLGLPVIKKTKTGYSTDAEVLERLEPYHEIIPNILHYRQLAKLQGTYIEGLLKEIRPETGKIHTFYQQTIAATGRLSSQYPNLQNIPIRLEEGRKIRKVFVPADSGWRILAADYSQIELRVLAHISQDERLIEAFRADLDIHTKTAMDVFGVSEDEVDANMRRSAKAVNFGIVYGISDYGLSQNLNITRKEAAEFIEQYFAIFQGVRRFMDEIVKQARHDSYVTTLLGRRRYLPDITASNYNLRSFAERTAMNSPIQGTAADIIKLAMVQLSGRMAEAKVNSRMLLQVHDELVLEVPEEEIDVMRNLMKETMEQAIQLDVPLKVDVSSGSNWYEAK